MDMEIMLKKKKKLEQVPEPTSNTQMFIFIHKNPFSIAHIGTLYYYMERIDYRIQNILLILFIHKNRIFSMKGQTP